MSQSFMHEDRPNSVLICAFWSLFKFDFPPPPLAITIVQLHEIRFRTYSIQLFIVWIYSCATWWSKLESHNGVNYYKLSCLVSNRSPRRALKRGQGWLNVSRLSLVPTEDLAVTSVFVNGNIPLPSFFHCINTQLVSYIQLFVVRLNSLHT